MRHMKITGFIAAAMILTLFIACGGGNNNNNNNSNVVVTITPTLSIIVGETKTLNVTRQNTDDFIVSVNPATGSGCVKSGINAVACTPTVEGTYTVTVTATADATKSASATVTVLESPIITAPVSTFTDLQAAIDDYETATGDMEIVITEDFSITDGFTISSNTGGVTTAGLTIPANAGGATLIIKGNAASRTLTRDFSGSMFTINSGAKLVLEEIIIDGNKGAYPNNTGSLVSVEGGEFTMNDGAVLRNNRVYLNNCYESNYRGVGVYVDSGEFTMNGGAISGNEGCLFGGGVLLNYGGGIFTMNGGAISGNTTAGMGGGVFIGMGEFTMNGGAISDNTTDGGGGVAVIFGEFTMNGGEISDNTADSAGAGVYIHSQGRDGAGKFTMNGGKITGNNIATYDPSGKPTGGGGVFIFGDGATGGIFTMMGGEISGNVAYFAGGGVFNAGTFTMNGGKITANTSYDPSALSAMGGGVLNNEGTFTMTGGEITRNTADFAGGGMASGGKFTMTGGKISDNTAAVGGGGAQLGGEFTMTGGEITGNTATGSSELGDDVVKHVYGGGVFALNTGKGKSEFMLTLGGTAVISGNAGNNLELAAYITLSTNNPPTPGMNIGVSIAESEWTGDVIVVESGATPADAVYFHADEPGKTVIYRDNQLVIVEQDDIVDGYVVQFITIGGSPVADQIVQTGDSIPEAPVTTREGFIFEGWFTDNTTFVNKVSFPYTPTGNITLYANWTKSSTVSFIANGGSPVANQIVRLGDSIPEAPVTTRVDHVFEGWFTDNITFVNKVSFPYTPTENTTLYANWTNIAGGIPGGGTVAAISAGFGHVVILKTDGVLWAWGQNNHGQLGNGTNINSNVPVQVSTDTDWVEVIAGNFHTLARKTDGSWWAWGENTYGGFGNGTNTDSNVPVPIGNWKSISLSSSNVHTVALNDDGTLWEWGTYAREDTLQGGDIQQIYTPMPSLAGGTDWVAVAAGDNHTIALKKDGTLWAWGINTVGQLGDETYINRFTPVQIRGKRWISGSEVEVDWTGSEIFAPGASTVVFQQDGSIWEWGADPRNNGSYSSHPNIKIGMAVIDGTVASWYTWDKLSSSTILRMAIKDGTLWAWGSNSLGAFGNGTIAPSNVTIQIGIDSDWAEISTGFVSTIALKKDGSLWTWGSNLTGALGDGTNTDSLFPIQIPIP